MGTDFKSRTNLNTSIDPSCHNLHVAVNCHGGNILNALVNDKVSVTDVGVQCHLRLVNFFKGY